jgi:hypothetical protein
VEPTSSSSTSSRSCPVGSFPVVPRNRTAAGNSKALVICFFFFFAAAAAAGCVCAGSHPWQRTSQDVVDRLVVVAPFDADADPDIAELVPSPVAVDVVYLFQERKGWHTTRRR